MEVIGPDGEKTFYCGSAERAQRAKEERIAKAKADELERARRERLRVGRRQALAVTVEGLAGLAIGAVLVALTFVLPHDEVLGRHGYGDPLLAIPMVGLAIAAWSAYRLCQAFDLVWKYRW